MPGPVGPHLIQVRAISVAELAAVLTDTLARLSPTRVGIVSDQLRAILHSERPSDLIAIAAMPVENSFDSSIIAIATLPEKGDTGTILHVDWAHPGQANDPQFAVRATFPLRDQLLARLSEHGSRFIQWATDPIAAPSSPRSLSIDRDGPAAWAMAMEFQNIGTLDYLAIDGFDQPVLGKKEDVPTTALPCPAPKPVAPQATTLRRVNFHSTEEIEAFEELVSETYHDSLDCPHLESHRTTNQILRSYQCVPSFAPDLWFTFHPAPSNCHPDPGNKTVRDAAGCCVLARHHNSENQELVLELVYMGIVPSQRGRRLGKQMMGHVATICRNQNAVRLVLAVDQANHPALAAYQQLGMQSLFRETIWVRSIEPK
jgi:ribosomal protein S18 acetylase RimI-like enzyme